ncbi:MAG: hypothetical protein AAB373_03615 [Patescibacteria group bacterium]
MSDPNSQAAGGGQSGQAGQTGQSGQGQQNLNPDQQAQNLDNQQDQLKDEADKDYANRVWQKIGKSMAKNQRADIKSEVPARPGEFNDDEVRSEISDDVPEVKKKRRRRRRKKKTPVEETAVVPVEKPVEEIVAVPAEKPAEEPAVIPAEKPVEPVMDEPINPFAQPVNLPPNTYEAAKVQKVQEEAPMVSENEVVDDGEPINPFAAPVVPPLEDKPLDRVSDVPQNPFADFQQEKHAEEIKENEAIESEPVNINDRYEDSDNDKDIREVEVVEATPVEPILAEAEVVSSEKEKAPDLPPPVAVVDHNDGFKEDFWTVLEQAGITRGKIVGAVVVLGFAILIFMGYAFGWYENLMFWKGGPDVSDVTVEEVEGDTDIEIVDSDQEGAQDSASPYDLVSSYVFGQEYNDFAAEGIVAQPISQIVKFGGYEAAFIFGQKNNLHEERYIEYLDLLNKMKNIYEVNIYEFMNFSTDRRESLEEYLVEMDALINHALIALDSLDANLAILDNEYEVLATQAAQYENEFFAYSEQYYGRAAFEVMDLYVAESQKAIEIKARYNAENALRTKFINYLNALRPRYEDISLNREAVIKGVKVFDIPESEIDAIIRLND